MPKLHLKRTPEEEALHRLRKKERKEAKRKHRGNYEDTQSTDPSSRKRPRKEEEPSEPERKWASSDEEQYGPQPAQSTSSSTGHNRSGEGGYMNENDDHFREKLFDAFADDERLDSLEATFNDFAHIPDRWKPHSNKPKYNLFEEDDWLKVNPEQLDEEDYAEWIRMGMYRKTHAEEYAEQQRRKAAEAARRAQAKARREERVKLEKEAEEEHKRKKHEREAHRWEHAREAYHAKWKALMAGNEDIGFRDIPWPIIRAHKHKDVTVDDLTLEAVSAFLLPTGGEQSRKEVLREAILRFHPDKFEGRLMRRVDEEEQAVVREGIGRVVRVLNSLMDD